MTGPTRPIYIGRCVRTQSTSRPSVRPSPILRTDRLYRRLRPKIADQRPRERLAKPFSV